MSARLHLFLHFVLDQLFWRSRKKLGKNAIHVTVLIMFWKEKRHSHTDISKIGYQWVLITNFISESANFKSLKIPHLENAVKNVFSSSGWRTDELMSWQDIRCQSIQSPFTRIAIPTVLLKIKTFWPAQFMTIKYKHNDHLMGLQQNCAWGQDHICDSQWILILISGNIANHWHRNLLLSSALKFNCEMWWIMSWMSYKFKQSDMWCLLGVRGWLSFQRLK